MKNYSITRANSKTTYKIEFLDNKLAICNADEVCTFFITALENRLIIESDKMSSEDVLDVASEVLFYNYPSAHEIFANNKQTTSRDKFFEKDGIWNVPTKKSGKNEDTITTPSFSHPARPEVKEGQLLYSRFIESISANLQIRVIDQSLDLEVFHEWHNQPRVAEFWELAQSKVELKSYILRALNDPHMIPVIVEINNEKAAYFEIYWAKEDRLGPYYESSDYDRGFHLLVGNTNYLGFKNTDAILKSVTHFIFLDESRTTKIMGEPRYDNEKILKYVLTFKAWRKIKEFDFPHKRAALLECDRSLFFQGGYL